MKTVYQHLKAAGYDPAAASMVNGSGLSECESVTLRKFPCSIGEDKFDAVEATENVRFSDGSLRPYPDGWTSLGTKMTVYFRKEEA